MKYLGTALTLFLVSTAHGEFSKTICDGLKARDLSGYGPEVRAGLQQQIDANCAGVKASTFTPLPQAKVALGTDFDWSKLDDEDAKKLNDCIVNGQCDAAAFKTANKTLQSVYLSVEVATCVKQQTCNLDAYLNIYQLTKSTDQAKKVSACVAAVVEKSCSLEAYRQTFQLTKAPTFSLDVAACVQQGQCQLERYLAVYKSGQSHLNALSEAKKSVKQQETTKDSRTDE